MCYKALDKVSWMFISNIIILQNQFHYPTIEFENTKRILNLLLFDDIAHIAMSYNLSLLLLD